jgi:hypothetical protein
MPWDPFKVRSYIIDIFSESQLGPAGPVMQADLVFAGYTVPSQAFSEELFQSSQQQQKF